MSRALLTRVAAASGALYVLLIIVGNAVATAGATGGNHPTGAQVLRAAERDAHSTAATVGFVLEVVGFTLFVVFLGYLAAVLTGRRGSESAGGRRTPDTWLSVLTWSALVSGSIDLAIKIGSAGPMVVLMMDRDQLDPPLARVLSDLNGVAFVVTWLPTALFVGAAALALREAGLVGRVLAYSGGALGAAGVVLALIGLRHPDTANPVAFLLALVWVLVASIRLAARPAGTAAEQVVAGPAVVLSQPVAARP